MQMMCRLWQNSRPGPLPKALILSLPITLLPYRI